MFASGDPDRADEIWAKVLAEIDGLVASVTEDDLTRLRNKLATGVTIGGERPGDRMQRIGKVWVYMNRYTTLEDELEQINRVTLQDLRDVAAAFPLRPVTVGRLLPA